MFGPPQMELSLPLDDHPVPETPPLALRQQDPASGRAREMLQVSREVHGLADRRVLPPDSGPIEPSVAGPVWIPIPAVHGRALPPARSSSATGSNIGRAPGRAKRQDRGDGGPAAAVARDAPVAAPGGRLAPGRPRRHPAVWSHRSSR